MRADEPSLTCLVTRTNALLDQYEAALNEAGIETYRIRRTEPEDRSQTGLRLATMHRIKGLEFDRIVIAGGGADQMLAGGGAVRSEDVAVREEAAKRERALHYVAATRARKLNLITRPLTPE